MSSPPSSSARGADGGSDAGSPPPAAASNAAAVAAACCACCAEPEACPPSSTALGGDWMEPCPPAATAAASIAGLWPSAAAAAARLALCFCSACCCSRVRCCNRGKPLRTAVWKSPVGTTCALPSASFYRQAGGSEGDESGGPSSELQVWRCLQSTLTHPPLQTLPVVGQQLPASQSASQPACRRAAAQRIPWPPRPQRPSGDAG